MYGGKFLIVCNHPARFGGHCYCGSGDDFSLSRDLSRLRDQKVMWLYRQEPIEVGYHPATFGGHKHSDNGDIVILVGHVILQDHVI